MICKECGNEYEKESLTPDSQKFLDDGFCQDCIDRMARTPVSEIITALHFQKTMDQLMKDK